MTARRTAPPLAALIGAAFLVVLTLLAVFADVLPFIRHPGDRVYVGDAIANRFALGPGRIAVFGTDALGNDVFAKCIYGARTTLVVGVGATMIGIVAGGLIGILAGYVRGVADRLAGVVTDALLAMPPIVLGIVMIAKLGDITDSVGWLAWLTRRWQITFTLGIIATAPLARIVRAQTLALREREFVVAARGIGTRLPRLLSREIVPNLVPTIVTVAFTGLGLLIAAEGALAFLGLSAETPTPTWGKLIDQNRNFLDEGWWATVAPCVMLFLTVLSFNLVGDRLATRFDIRRAAL